MHIELRKFWMVFIAALSATIELASSADRVDIQVNRTATLADDYITWGPTPCRIRINPLIREETDLTVILTNDVTSVPPGRTQPLDGDVSFAKAVSLGETACEPTLELTLPKDGSWVNFFIAGRFPDGATVGRSSSQDKDTVIEVHNGGEDGSLIGSHSLMVRVRKNLQMLTNLEKHRLLSAINELRVRGIYEKFVEVHDWAARGDRRHLGRINHPAYSYPDAAHRDSNFLAWHRIDLLQFERELQKIYPDVAVHYWKLDEGDPAGIVFSEDLYGSNEVDTATPNLPVLNRTPYLDFVKFSRSNPLHGWRISYQGRFANSELLTRWPVDRTRRPWLLGTSTNLPGEQDVLLQSDFLDFMDGFEAETHNKSHHWFGPPMRDCTVAPVDPFFWSFHSWFDRVWAKWQWKYDRFSIDGANNSYEPLGKFPEDSPVHPRGHYLEDTMWPWDGIVGEGVHADPSIRYLQSRPPKAPMGAFPASDISGLWPQAPAHPRVKDALDYFGMDIRASPHGYCYDDLPFGTADENQKRTLEKADTKRAEFWAKTAGVFTDRSAAKEKRVEAAESLPTGYALENITELMVIMKAETDADLKAQALRLLSTNRETRREALKYAIAILVEGEAPLSLQLEILRILETMTHFAPRDSIEYSEIQSALRKSGTDSKDSGVRKASLATSVKMGDAGAIERVRNALREENTSILDRSQGVALLATNGGGREHRSFMHDSITSANHAEAMTVILNTPIDQKNIEAVNRVIFSQSNPVNMRVAALHSIVGHDSFVESAIKLLYSPAVPVEIQSETIALLEDSIQNRGIELNVENRKLLFELEKHLSPLLQPKISDLLRKNKE